MLFEYEEPFETVLAEAFSNLVRVYGVEYLPDPEHFWFEEEDFGIRRDFTPEGYVHIYRNIFGQEVRLKVEKDLLWRALLGAGVDVKPAGNSVVKESSSEEFFKDEEIEDLGWLFE